jgi:hypothetical protein
VTGITVADSSWLQEECIRMENTKTGVNSLNLIIKKFSNLTSTAKIGILGTPVKKEKQRIGFGS